MALNQAAADAVAALLMADTGATHPALLTWYSQLVGRIYEGIVANAVVQPTALAAPQNAGPVTGTGTIT